MMRGIARQVVALVALAILVVGGLAGVAQLKFTSFLSESVRERLEIVAATTARDFETAIDLGLRIDQVANGDFILGRALSHDSDIEAIVVFDAQGGIVHFAGQSTLQSVAAETLEAYRLAGEGITGPVWRVETDDSIASGSLIQGSFGRPVAGIEVVYPKNEMDAQTSVMAGNLLLDAGIVALGLGVGFAGMLAALRRRSRVRPAEGSAP